MNIAKCACGAIVEMGKRCNQCGERFIRLQAIGWCKAIDAADVKVGMTWFYNYGYSYTVTGITPGDKSIRFSLLSEDGQVYTRRCLPTTAVVAR